jgi:hypothetical protein
MYNMKRNRSGLYKIHNADAEADADAQTLRSPPIMSSRVYQHRSNAANKT